MITNNITTSILAASFWLLMVNEPRKASDVIDIPENGLNTPILTSYVSSGLWFESDTNCLNVVERLRLTQKKNALKPGGKDISKKEFFCVKATPSK